MTNIEALKTLYTELGGTDDVSTIVTIPEMINKLTEVSGSSVTVEPLSVTANDTYTAPSGKAYSPVTVNVPSAATMVNLGTYSTGDTFTGEQTVFELWEMDAEAFFSVHAEETAAILPMSAYDSSTKTATFSTTDSEVSVSIASDNTVTITGDSSVTIYQISVTYPD